MKESGLLLLLLACLFVFFETGFLAVVLAVLCVPPLYRPGLKDPAASGSQVLGSKAWANATASFLFISNKETLSAFSLYLGIFV